MCLKKCTKCKKSLELELFSKDSQKKDGYCSSCKKCTSKNTKKYYKKNKKEVKEKSKIYRENNKDKQYEKTKEWCQKNKEYLKKHRKEYYHKNKKKIMIVALKAYHRRKYDPEFKISHLLRGRVRNALNLQNVKKLNNTFELVGCTVMELKIHLHSLFKEGMTWENHGRNGWHIDHIKPCISFNLLDPEQQKICFHYTNLQPLWESENTSKGSLHDGKRYKKK